MTPTRTNEIKLTQIRPHAGSQRAGFEEMTYQLFANDYANQGTAVRREGRGGDAGLEGFIEDDGGHVIIGHQAKFFIDRLEARQWEQIDTSVRRALHDNSQEGALREYIVTMPRNLNQAQHRRWNDLKTSWTVLAKEFRYSSEIKFRFWGESEGH